MKFPITRETLQAFDQITENAEKKEDRIQKLLRDDVKQICNEVEKGMTLYSREKRFIWNGLRANSRFSRNQQGPAYIHVNIDEYLPRLIEKLKETFIGCDIITDPLKTYIVISWS